MEGGFEHCASSEEAGNSSAGDHDLDALMLALLAAEMKFGLLEPKVRPHGIGVAFAPAVGSSMPETTKSGQPPTIQDAVRQARGIPSRGANPQAKPVASKARLAYLMRNGGFVYPNGAARPSGRPIPGRGGPGARPGSRTAVFRGSTPRRGGYGV